MYYQLTRKELILLSISHTVSYPFFSSGKREVGLQLMTFWMVMLVAQIFSLISKHISPIRLDGLTSKTSFLKISITKHITVAMHFSYTVDYTMAETNSELSPVRTTCKFSASDNLHFRHQLFEALEELRVRRVRTHIHGLIQLSPN